MFKYMRQGRDFYKNLFKLALPITLQNLIMTSLALIDTIMVGFLGEAPLAGVMVANTPMFVLQLLIFGLQSGSAVLISQFWGKRDEDSINKVIGIGLYLAGTLGALFSLVTILFPRELMSLFSNNEELIDIAASYIRIVGTSHLFHGMAGIFAGAYRSMANPKPGLYIFGFAMCLSTFLNWVLIFGNLGAPALGVEGAAIGTLIARVVEFIIMVIYVKVNRRFVMKLKLVLRPGKEMIGKFIKYAVPVVMNETLWGMGMAIYPTIMGHMENSREIMAALTITLSLDRLITVAIWSIGVSAGVIVGKEIGEGRAHKVYDKSAALSTVAVGLGILIGGGMLVAMYVWIAPYIFPLFGLSALAVSIGLMMQTINCIIKPARALNTVLIVGVLRAGGDSRVAAFIDLIPLWLLSLPLALIFGLVLKLDIFWVYLAMSIDSLVKGAASLWRFYSRRWINDITAPAASG